MSGDANLSALAGSLSGRRVVVLGDLVADEYLLCRTSRISREAPAALILRHEGRELVPGGGANAVANLRALGAEVDVVGVVGADTAGEELLQALAARQVDTAGVVAEAGFRTVVKSRVLTSYHQSIRQQVLRIDREDQLADGSPASLALAARVRERLAGADALLISDYSYGSASPTIANPLIAEARARRIPVTLDSRYRILSYRGVSAATPNQPEVEEALGLAIGDDLALLEQGGRDLLDRLDAEALVVTRGSQGMTLLEARRPTEHIPVYGSDEIADVTGAGDTVIATFTLALAAGASYASAARIANCAGGLVVMKRGTATVTSDQLRAALAVGRE